MKISEYPSIGSLNPSAKLVIDDPSGTKTITGAALQYALFDNIPCMHSQIFRGKNLGTSITSSQFNHISNGDFSGLWLGDYWMLGGNKWVIIDFDYAHKAGIKEHHIAIMQMSGNESKPLHEDVVYNAGYGKLTMHKTTLPDIAKSIKNRIGASHVHSLTTRYTLDFNNDLNTAASNSEDTLDEAWLPSQIQILGARVHKNPRWNVAGYTDSTNQSRQFAYFRMSGHSLPEGLDSDNMWLCDQVFGTYYVGISGSSGLVFVETRNTSMKCYPYVFIS